MTLPSTAAEIARAVASGAVSAEQIALAALARVRSLDPELNAFTEITAERAIAEARAVDARRRRGDRPGPLAGVPYAVKNLFDIRGRPTLAGSKINRDLPPADRDAGLLERMTAAGAVLLGALNMGEYAYDFTGENAHFGPSRNPHDRLRMTGGSSGGSAAAVAAGLAPLALASDTNGSIRVPSALCGVFGLKPTFGRLTRTGAFPFCDSLDHVGPMARTVMDLSLCYDALQGPDQRDPVCADRPPEPVTDHLKRGAAGLRIALLGGYFRESTDVGVWPAIEALARGLDVREEIALAGADVARAAAFLITNAESGSLHLPNLRSRPQDFDPDTRDRLLAGAMLPPAWRDQALQFRELFRARMLALFADFDVLLAPAAPCRAPAIGQTQMVINGRNLAVRPNLGVLTQPISFVGLPVAVAPVFPDRGLPTGIQIIAAPWREDLCLRVAATLESAGACSAQRPETMQAPARVSV